VCTVQQAPMLTSVSAAAFLPGSKFQVMHANAGLTRRAGGVLPAAPRVRPLVWRRRPSRVCLERFRRRRCPLHGPAGRQHARCAMHIRAALAGS
jgi:hypothetical protein